MNRYRSIARKAAFLACALCLLLGAWPVLAQDAAPTLKTASLLLWPEYDDPGLLVIFAGSFADQTGFPRDISVPLPAGARNVQAAYPDASGNLLVADAEVSGSTLTFKQLPVAAFHVEYYLDRAATGNQREIVYPFQAPYAIEALSVTAQQPARATDFTLDPAAAGSATRDDGLTYFTFSRTDLAAGAVLPITLRYTKADDNLTNPQLAVPNPAGTPAAGQAVAEPAARAGIGDWLPWVLVGLGAAMLAGWGIYWLLTRRGQRPAAAAGAPARSGAPAKRPATAGAAEFCPQCGHPHRPEDRFCSQCGAPRRS